MDNLNWDKIKEELAKSVKLEKNKEDLSVIIKTISANIEENKLVGGMLKGEEEMKQSLSQFLGHPVECNIDINQEEKYMVLKFENKKDFKKVYKLFNDLFFGDFLKQMIEAMMEVFKGFGSGDMDFSMGPPMPPDEEE